MIFAVRVYIVIVNIGDCLYIVDFRPLMTSMYDSLFGRLQDNVAPVREAAAIALSCAVSAYGMSQ